MATSRNTEHVQNFMSEAKQYRTIKVIIRLYLNTNQLSIYQRNKNVHFKAWLGIIEYLIRKKLTISSTQNFKIIGKLYHITVESMKTGVQVYIDLCKGLYIFTNKGNR